VMDAAGLERAAVFGWSEGGPMSILFAATYPQRSSALVLYGTKPGFVRTSDHPWGIAPEEIESALDGLEAGWGRIPMVHLAPTGNERYRSWLLRYQQAAASPAATVPSSAQTARSTSVTSSPPSTCLRLC
jgi:pimeloyl-ACP methyl ester carboxylesterase